MSLIRTHQGLQRLVDDIKQACTTNNITTYFPPTAHVEVGGSFCSGYFAHNDRGKGPKLVVAFGKPEIEYLPVLIHESCHMDQYLEQCDVWKDIIVDINKDTTDLMFEWFAGKEVDDPMDLIKRSMAVEIDCEKRTVEKIKEYELQDILDIAEYTQKANSYVFYYLYSYWTRRFYEPGKEPYNNPSVWTCAPWSFNVDYSKIPEKLRLAYVNYT